MNSNLKIQIQLPAVSDNQLFSFGTSCCSCCKDSASSISTLNNDSADQKMDSDLKCQKFNIILEGVSEEVGADVCESIMLTPHEELNSSDCSISSLYSVVALKNQESLLMEVPFVKNDEYEDTTSIYSPPSVSQSPPAASLFRKRRLYTRLVTLKLEADVEKHLEFINDKFGYGLEYIFKLDHIGFFSYLLCDVPETVIRRIQQRPDVAYISGDNSTCLLI